jgi:hypothetical protein
VTMRLALHHPCERTTIRSSRARRRGGAPPRLRRRVVGTTGADPRRGGQVLGVPRHRRRLFAAGSSACDATTGGPRTSPSAGVGIRRSSHLDRSARCWAASRAPKARWLLAPVRGRHPVFQSTPTGVARLPTVSPSTGSRWRVVARRAVSRPSGIGAELDEEEHGRRRARARLPFTPSIRRREAPCWDCRRAALVLYLPFPLPRTSDALAPRRACACRHDRAGVRMILARRWDYWPSRRKGWNDRRLVEVSAVFLRPSTRPAHHEEPAQGSVSSLRRSGLADHVFYDLSHHPPTILEL